MRLSNLCCVSPRWMAATVILLLCSAAARSQTDRNPSGIRWLVAGPFAAAGENALFHDQLGDEAFSNPRGGEIAVAGSNVRWQASLPSADGVFDLGAMWKGHDRSAAYAYSEILSADGKPAVITLGSGPEVQLRLNGELLFESRLSRKPESNRDMVVLPLRKGVNRLMIKTIGAGDWKLQYSLHRPEADLFINQAAAIIPDFRSGVRMSGAWGQIEVANASGGELKDVVVELQGNDYVLPSASGKVDVAAGEVTRIPFWIAGNSPVSGQTIGPLRIRVSAGSDSQNFDVTPSIRKPEEYFVTTYRSFVDGSVQPFSVLLPVSFDPGKVYPLILLLHGAHVTSWGQNIISYDAKDWALQVAVHDRGNNRYRDIGEVDLDEVLSEVKRLYRIDQDRIYLSGHSMGGYGTWFQATHRPDLWASVSPQAGYSDYSLYTSRNSRRQKAPEYQERLFESWSPLAFAENLLHVPAYIVHGAKDDNVSVEHSRLMARRLKELRYDFVYDENPEGGHWWGPRGKDFGVEVVDKPAIWAFLRKQERRVSGPRRVVFKTDTLRYRKAYWVEIDELDEANRLARVDAEIKSPGRIDMGLNNITQFTLRLDEDLIEADRPVVVNANGIKIFEGVLPPSKRLTLRRTSDGGYLQLFDDTDLRTTGVDAVERFDRTAVRLDGSGLPGEVVTLPNEPLKKTETIYGPAADAFTRPFIFIVGTRAKNGNDAKMILASRRAAQFQRREWMVRADGRVEIKLDSEVTPQDIATYNLVLFGNSTVNSLIARINGRVPVNFSGQGIGAGRKRFAGVGTGAVLTFPNPLNRDRFVVILGGLDPKSMETAGRLRLNELPDYVIFDKNALAGERVRFVAAGFLDKYWRLPASAVEESE